MEVHVRYQCIWTAVVRREQILGSTALGFGDGSDCRKKREEPKRAPCVWVEWERRVRRDKINSSALDPFARPLSDPG